MRRRRLVLAALAASAGAVSFAQAGPVRVIEVVARRFVFLPSEITISRGETVELVLSAPEVVMGFNAPELKLRTVIVPGQVARLRFVADRVGAFDFVCDVFCGDGHEGMAGRILVRA